MKAIADPRRPSFRRELRDFLGFLRRPRLGPRLQGRGMVPGAVADCWPAASGAGLGRLLQWALVLWVVNLVLLGPIAVAAATAAGATHRLNLHDLPWLTALLWAPLIEELVFRQSLRRPLQFLWLVPAAGWIMLQGPQWPYTLLAALLLLLAFWPLWRGARRAGVGGMGSMGGMERHAGDGSLPGRRVLGLSVLGRRVLGWRGLRAYRRFFPWVFHGCALAFALMHLNNFHGAQAAGWLLPLLVLPQWLTGLVLGWLRVRRGIGAAILLHAIFNAGPLLLVWTLLRFMPDLAGLEGV